MGRKLRIKANFDIIFQGFFMDREEILLKNWYAVQNSLSRACSNARRDKQEVTLVAVTKYAKDTDVLTLLHKGLLTHIGESRVQDAWKRWKQNELFAPFTQVKKHFIGHLQLNKAAKAAVLFDFIDSLDSVALAQALSKAVPAGKALRVLVQIKLTRKESQSGLSLPQARELVKKLRALNLPAIRVCGYMGIAPQGKTSQTLRELFKQVKAVFDEDFFGEEEKYLSLGMSEDFEIAVEEGSSLPRIGSKLFSDHLEE